jgi:raffinose/stachyose/melibiose transport system permease protein
MTRSRLPLLLAAFVALLWVLPLARLAAVSMRDGGLSNYGAVIVHQGLLRYVANSAIITVAAVTIVLLFASSAAFAFSKLRFPGRRTLFLVLMSGLMIPVASVLVPLTEIERLFGWTNTYQGLFLPYAALALPFALVILRSSYDGLPDELMEAAALDGAGAWHTFRSVYLPMTRPAMVMVGIWTFLSSWNEFLLALLFATDPDQKTITVVPASFQLEFFVDVPKLFAALVLIELPIVLLYATMQRTFERGLTAGAIK